MDFTISFRKVTREITGASGLVKCGGFYYALGDNSPFLFKLNGQFDIVLKYPIYAPYDHYQEEPIPKSRKPDFEAFEVVGENVMIGLGSGSKSPERDRAIVITLGNPISITRYDLAGFYSALKAVEILKGHELNIEAAAFVNQTLYLFNRGKNIIFSLDYQKLLAFLDGSLTCPEIHYDELELPYARGIQSGFSGATIDHASGTMIITSSVENTSNAYDDGEILGSYIGLVPIENRKIKPPVRWTPVEYQGSPLKVESVAIDGWLGKRNVELVLTVDNDDGQSHFLRGNLVW